MFWRVMFFTGSCLSADPISRLEHLESQWMNVLSLMKDSPRLELRAAAPFNWPDTFGDVTRFVGLINSDEDLSVFEWRDFFTSEARNGIPWTWARLLEELLGTIVQEFGIISNNLLPSTLLGRGINYQRFHNSVHKSLDFLMITSHTPILHLEPTANERARIDAFIVSNEISSIQTIFPPDDSGRTLGGYLYALGKLSSLVADLQVERDAFVGHEPVGSFRDLLDLRAWLSTWLTDFEDISLGYEGDEELILEYVEESLFEMLRSVGVVISVDIWDQIQEKDVGSWLIEYADSQLSGLLERRLFLTLEGIGSLLMKLEKFQVGLINNIGPDTELMIESSASMAWMVDDFRVTFHMGSFATATLDPILFEELRAYWQSRMPTPPQHYEDLSAEITEALLAIRDELRATHEPFATSFALAHVFREISRQWVYDLGVQPLWQERFVENIPLLEMYHAQISVLFGNLRSLTLIIPEAATHIF